MILIVMKCLILCFHDLGRDQRLIRHALSLINLKNAQITLVGLDLSDIPQDLIKSRNIKVKYIYPFVDTPYFLVPIFWIFRFVFYFIQVLGIAIHVSSLELIISSTEHILTETIISYLISRIKKAKLVFDLTPFAWTNENSQFTSTKKVSKTMYSLADYRVSQTRSMQLVLKLGGIESFFIPSEPEKIFKPVPEYRNSIIEILNVNKASLLIAVPIMQFNDNYFQTLIKIAKHLDNKNIYMTFIILGSGKSQKMVDDKINKLDFKMIKFKFFPFQYDIYPKIIGSCDLGICFEGSPLVLDVSHVLLEMNACHIPIIATQFGCVNEIVKNGENGIIVDGEQEMIDVFDKLFIKNTLHLNDIKPKESLPISWDQAWNDAFSMILPQNTKES